MDRTKQSSIKRHKASDVKQNMASIDRLSGLPLARRILSFLPTKISVSTSIFGRRWRFLWAHVPSLDFKSGHLHRELSILDIINRVMLLYKVESMNTFSLSYAGDHDDRSKFQLETCITTAILRNVKKLHLCLLYYDILPHCIFTFKTLVDLWLVYCGDIPMTGTVYLPALKRLHLDSVKYESDESLSHLLSGCPVLEELIIRFLDMVCFYISSPTIKRLILESDFYVRRSGEACNLKIDTPALRYLQLQDCIPNDVSDGTLASLIEAKIIIGGLTVMGEVSRMHRYYYSVLEFVGGLRNVKCLKLSIVHLIVLDFSFSDLTTKFHNFTKVELTGDGRFVSYFLENADNLEVVIINMLKSRMEYPHETKCLSSHLRTVTIGRFGCTEQEFELIRYLLWNAKVLKRMEIYSQCHVTCFKQKFEALKRISLFPRGSIACELDFH